MKENQNQAQGISPSPNNDKSRNVTGGYGMLAQLFPFVNFVMFIFGWFTIPIEVLFRRNFGQRWLTVVNFYAGLVVLFGFTFLQLFSGAFSSPNNNYHYPQQPLSQSADPSVWDSLMSKSMLIFLLAYLLISSYHFFRMWWRDRTLTALHSFNDGTSRFEPIGNLLMQVVNIAAIPFIRLYILFLPTEERQRKINIPALNEDVTAFTNTVFEPLMLLILALIFPGVARIWLLLSAAALVIYANWKETAKLNRVLDFRDSIIDAKTMFTNRVAEENATTENLIIKQGAETMRTIPQVTTIVGPRYPDVMSIIKEMGGGKDPLDT